MIDNLLIRSSSELELRHHVLKNGPVELLLGSSHASTGATASGPGKGARLGLDVEKRSTLKDLRSNDSASNHLSVVIAIFQERAAAFYAEYRVI